MRQTEMNQLLDNDAPLGIVDGKPVLLNGFLVQLDDSDEQTMAIHERLVLALIIAFFFAAAPAVAIFLVFGWAWRLWIATVSRVMSFVGLHRAPDS